MKNNTAKWELAGYVFTVIFGTVLHFLYNWSGDNNFVAAFSAVNESTWEHLKLIFFPFVVFAVIQYFFACKKQSGFFTVKAISVMIGMAFIVSVFYTYSGIVGKNSGIFNIIIFFAGAAASSFYSYKSAKKYNSNICGIILLLLFSLLFILFTFSPPNIGLFLDPQTMTYGIVK